MKKKNLIIFFPVILLLAYYILHASKALAAPSVLVTWSAPENLVPPGYEGKALPTAGSSITASVEVIDEGKIANISDKAIYWYVNGKFIEGGVGVKKVNIGVPPLIFTGSFELRVRILNYKREEVGKIIFIPVVFPKAVIEAPFPNREFTKTAIELKALPYFFKTTSHSRLKFEWKVNGKIPSEKEKPDTLIVNINPDAKSGSTLIISLSIKIPESTFGAKSEDIVLTYR